MATNAPFSAPSRPPLFEAVANGDASAVTALIASGADPNEVFNSRTPLIVAAETGLCDDVIRALLAAGADPTYSGYASTTPIHQSAKIGDLGALKVFFENEANKYVDLQNKYQQTPLRLAAEYDLDEIAEFLIAAGASLNIRDDSGYTALCAAAEYGSCNVLRQLLVAGADPSIANDDGKTPKEIAELDDLDEVLEILEEFTA